eukprot:PhM_4_TR13466/c0_g2_i1/m.99057
MTLSAPLLACFKRRHISVHGKADTASFTTEQWTKLWEATPKDAQLEVHCELLETKANKDVATVETAVSNGAARADYGNAQVSLVATLRQWAVEMQTHGDGIDKELETKLRLLLRRALITTDEDGPITVSNLLDIESAVRTEVKNAKKVASKDKDKDSPAPKKRTKEDGTKVGVGASSSSNGATRTIDELFAKAPKVSKPDAKRVESLKQARSVALAACSRTAECAGCAPTADVVDAIAKALGSDVELDALDELRNAVTPATSAGEASTSAVPDGASPTPEAVEVEVVQADAKEVGEKSSDNTKIVCPDVGEVHPAYRAFLGAVLTEINRLEGFKTPPLPSAAKRAPKDVEKRQKRIEREEELEAVRRKKAEEKAERDRIKAEKARAMRPPSEDLSIPVADMKPLPIVRHDANELGVNPPERFTPIVKVWSFLHSCPSLVKLSRANLTTFVQALHDERDTILMEHACRGLLEINGVESSSMPTRGRSHWMTEVVELLAREVGLEKKIKKAPEAPVKKYKFRGDTSSSEEDSSDDDDDEEESLCTTCEKAINGVVAKCSSCEGKYHLKCAKLHRGPNKSWVCPKCVAEDDTDEEPTQQDKKEKSEDAAAPTEGAEAGTAEGKPTAVVDDDESEEEEEELDENDVLRQDIIAVVNHARELGTYCSWPNFTPAQRLTILTALVEASCRQPDVRVHFVDAHDERQRQVLETSRMVKELRDEADRAVIIASTDDEKAQIRKKCETRCFDLEHKLFLQAERLDSHAGFVRPLGEDRYRRLYWRFPMDRRLFVQTTAESVDVRPEELEAAREQERAASAQTGTSATLIFDEEEEEDHATTGKKKSASPTRGGGGGAGEWATLPWSCVPGLIDSLNYYGKRERGLKMELTALAAHMDREYSLTTDSEEAIALGTMRVTRSRAVGGGYLNRLR